MQVLQEPLRSKAGIQVDMSSGAAAADHDDDQDDDEAFFIEQLVAGAAKLNNRPSSAVSTVSTELSFLSELSDLAYDLDIELDMAVGALGEYRDMANMSKLCGGVGGVGGGAAGALMTVNSRYSMSAGADSSSYDSDSDNWHPEIAARGGGYRQTPSPPGGGESAGDSPARVNADSFSHKASCPFPWH